METKFETSRCYIKIYRFSVGMRECVYKNCDSVEVHIIMQDVYVLTVTYFAVCCICIIHTFLAGRAENGNERRGCNE